MSKTLLRSTLALLCTIAIQCGAATSQAATTSTVTAELQARVRVLLDDYSHKDVAGIVDMLDGGADLLMMGSDLTEVAASRAAIAHLLQNDFELWDSSKFGPYRNFFATASGDMASALFDVPWTVKRDGKERSFTIRIATVWHRTTQGWKLVQILNTVPTVNQSAQ